MLPHRFLEVKPGHAVSFSVFITDLSIVLLRLIAVCVYVDAEPNVTARKAGTLRKTPSEMGQYHSLNTLYVWVKGEGHGAVEKPKTKKKEQRHKALLDNYGSFSIIKYVY